MACPATRAFAFPAVAGLLAATLSAFPAGAAWTPSHVVVVIEENHAYGQIIGNPNAPFINKLATEGALFTDAHGIVHPSQPNYLALFSGSTQGVTDDNPVRGTPLTSPNLASEILAHGHTFVGYSENLPAVGSTVTVSHGLYARKHNPWSNWQAANPAPNQLPASINRPFTDFPSDFAQLPTVAFVVPNIADDEHGDGTVADQKLIRASDDWLQKNLSSYIKWAKTHSSLLVITWDEDNYTKANHIPMILYGSDVVTGKYNQRIDHYTELRMVEGFFGLSHIGASDKATDITGALP